MRKTIFSIIAVILLLAEKTAYADYDISGRWLLEGGGFAEKSALRVELTDEGFLDIQTQIEGDVRYVLGYSVGLWLNASKIGVNAWEYHKKVDLEFPIPMPSLDPTMSEPFELPPVTVDRLTYEVTFTSLLSGTVKIYGHLDIDVVGDV